MWKKKDGSYKTNVNTAHLNERLDVLVLCVGLHVILNDFLHAIDVDIHALLRLQSMLDSLPHLPLLRSTNRETFLWRERKLKCGLRFFFLLDARGKTWLHVDRKTERQRRKRRVERSTQSSLHSDSPQITTANERIYKKSKERFIKCLTSTTENTSCSLVSWPANPRNKSISSRLSLL